MKISRDRNGNKVLVVQGKDIGRKTGFSIQTLGNMPKTHRDGIGQWTEVELRAHVRRYGTVHQRLSLGIKGGDE